MPDFELTERNRVRRVPKRGHYDRATIDPIVDEALICHVGFVQDGQPFVIPTLHARAGDEILLHGAVTSRLIQHIQAGNPVCITCTLVDGLVLAHSVFDHSINYRSAVLFGCGRLLEGEEEKLHALQVFTEKLLPGRWQDARQPNGRELKATAVAALTIESASAKIRSGPPSDEAEDADWPAWCGVLPLAQTVGQPQASDDRQPLPGYLKDFIARLNR